jgi:hypothetical protein
MSKGSACAEATAAHTTGSGGPNQAACFCTTGLLGELREEDQRAIRTMVGRPAMLVGYSDVFGSEQGRRVPGCPPLHPTSHKEVQYPLSVIANFLW